MKFYEKIIEKFFINSRNSLIYEPVETIKAYCLICGSKTYFDSNEPIDFPCKRNSFYCRKCGSVARNRHVAKIILEKFETFPKSENLIQFAKRTNISMQHTCASGAMHNALKISKNYVVSEYYDGVKSGDFLKDILCQDLMQMSFPDNSFDLVITEDVFEHIPDPTKACLEIKRILKPGGYHISTISVLWNLPNSVVRCAIENGNIVHYLPPAFHGDPNRPEGALVYVDFGADIVEKYLSQTGETEVLWSNRNRQDEEQFAIFNNMVFVSKK